MVHTYGSCWSNFGQWREKRLSDCLTTLVVLEICSDLYAQHGSRERFFRATTFHLSKVHEIHRQCAAIALEPAICAHQFQVIDFFFCGENASI